MSVQLALRFEHLFVDFRYRDAKPGGVQLYSTLLLEGFSRTILAGSLTPQQNAGVLLHVYFQGLLSWGLWEEVISDHGGQFIDRDWIRVNECDLKQKMAQGAAYASNSRTPSYASSNPIK